MLDVLIRGGRVIDGSGAPPFEADVGIAAGRVTGLAPTLEAHATITVEASGLFVCPGFIDMHTHSDVQLLVEPDHDAKVRQGVTLEVLGQDGLSYAPASGEALAQLDRLLAGWHGPLPDGWRSDTVASLLDLYDAGVTTNVVYLVPHATVRMMVMGTDNRAPSRVELAAMCRLVDESLADGAVGLSAGLTYVPGMFASDDEIVELCKVLRGTGAYYCPHHRNYGARALEAYRDCIEIARRADVPLHLAHAHLNHEVNRGRASALLTLIDDAIADGVDVSLDTYPYIAGSTYLHAWLPSWAQEHGPEDLLRQLGDREVRERIRVEMEETGSDGYHGVPIDWGRIVISGVTRDAHRKWSGVTVADAAVATATAPIDFYCDLLIAEALGCSGTAHHGNEENVQEIMRHPAHMVGSDGILTGSRPHPRGWGTFPRYLGRYVRDLGVLTWEQAVRKMTSLPAQRLGLADRGELRIGAVADVTCFDPATVADRATYEDPRQYPVGIDHVMVGGQFVIRDGEHTHARPGRSIRPGARARASGERRPGDAA